MSDDLDFPRFTAAIATVAMATMLGLTEFGDQALDPFFSGIGLGENISDLLKAIYLVAACSFFAGQSLNTLVEAVPGDRTFDSRRFALIGCGTIAIALAVLSRVSSARTVAVNEAAQLDDPATVAYLALFWSTILTTALLVTAAAAVGVRDHGIHGQLAAMGMAGMASVVVATFVLAQLLIDRQQMTAWLTTYGQWWTVPGLVGITIAGLLGIPRRPLLACGG